MEYKVDLTLEVKGITKDAAEKILDLIKWLAEAWGGRVHGGVVEVSDVEEKET